MRLAVIGRTPWLLDAARRLRAVGHNIVLVATAPAAPEYAVGEKDFETFARDCGAPFWSGRNLNAPEVVAEMAGVGATVAVSVNWPSLIRSDAVAAFPKGILNAHAGDLPRYRGNACPNWAILNGEAHVGACIHAMDPYAVDAGPIYVRRHLPLTEETYIADVYCWLDESVPAMFEGAIELVSDPGFTPEDQALSPVRPLRSHPRRPEDGRIDWSEPADRIARLVRASSRPFAGAFTWLEGEVHLTVWRARAVVLDHDLAAVPGQIMGRGPEGGVLVACGRDALEIEEADREDGAALPAANRFRLTSVAAG